MEKIQLCGGHRGKAVKKKLGDTLTSQHSAHECFALFLVNMLFTDAKSSHLNDSLVPHHLRTVSMKNK